MVNDAADLERVLDEVDARLAPLAVSPKRSYAVRLALDELLSNVIRYGYDDQAVHRIGLKLETGNPFSLTIEDDRVAHCESAGKIRVSIPESLRFTAAWVYSHSQSEEDRPPLTIMVAPTRDA